MLKTIFRGGVAALAFLWFLSCATQQTVVQVPTDVNLPRTVRVVAQSCDNHALYQTVVDLENNDIVILVYNEMNLINVIRTGIKVDAKAQSPVTGQRARRPGYPAGVENSARLHLLPSPRFGGAEDRVNDAHIGDHVPGIHRRRAPVADGRGEGLEEEPVLVDDRRAVDPLAQTGHDRDLGRDVGVGVEGQAHLEPAARAEHAHALERERARAHREPGARGAEIEQGRGEDVGAAGRVARDAGRRGLGLAAQEETRGRDRVAADIEERAPAGRPHIAVCSRDRRSCRKNESGWSAPRRSRRSAPSSRACSHCGWNLYMKASIKRMFFFCA